jgi:hypothetical protein
MRKLFMSPWVAPTGRTLADTVFQNPKDYLTPRTYAALLPEAPFVEPGMANVKSRKAKSVVVGLQREGSDEG